MSATLLRNRVLADTRKNLEMRSSWQALKPPAVVFRRCSRGDMDGGGGPVMAEAEIRAAWPHQTPLAAPRGRGTQEARPCPHLGFRHLASGTREYFCHLSLSMCGNFYGSHRTPRRRQAELGSDPAPGQISCVTLGRRPCRVPSPPPECAPSPSSIEKVRPITCCSS